MAIKKLVPNVAARFALMAEKGEKTEGQFGIDFAWKVQADGSPQTFYARPDLNHMIETLIISDDIRLGQPFEITKATDAKGKEVHFLLRHRNGLRDTANLDKAPAPATAVNIPPASSPAPSNGAPSVPPARLVVPESPEKPASVASTHAPAVADKAALYAQCFMEILIGMRGLNGNGLSEGEIRQAATAVFIECGKSNIKADRDRIKMLKTMLEQK